MGDKVRGAMNMKAADRFWRQEPLATRRKRRAMSLVTFGVIVCLIAALHFAFWAVRNPHTIAPSVEQRLPSVSYNRFASIELELRLTGAGPLIERRQPEAERTSCLELIVHAEAKQVDGILARPGPHGGYVEILAFEAPIRRKGIFCAEADRNTGTPMCVAA